MGDHTEPSSRSGDSELIDPEAESAGTGTGTGTDTRTGTARRSQLVVAAATPTGVHVEADGTTEVIVARTAVKEIAFHVVPVMAPAWGRRWGTQSAVVAFGWHDPDDTQTSVALGRRLSLAADHAAGLLDRTSVVIVEDPDIDVVAVKAADRGSGTIVRLRDWAPPQTDRRVVLALHPRTAAGITAAHLADSRERDLATIAVIDGALSVPITGHLTTVRLITRPL